MLVGSPCGTFHTINKFSLKIKTFMWLIYQAWYWLLGFRRPYIGMFSYYWVHDQLMVWVSVNLKQNLIIRWSFCYLWLQTLSSCISRPKPCPISCANKLPFLQNPKRDTNYYEKLVDALFLHWSTEKIPMQAYFQSGLQMQFSSVAALRVPGEYLGWGGYIEWNT